MKIWKCFACLTVFVLCLSGCNENRETDKKQKTEETFSYDLKDVSSFTVSGGDLYVSYIGKNKIEKLGKDGEKKESNDFSDGDHKYLMHCENELLSLNFQNDHLLLEEMNLETKELRSRNLQDLRRQFTDIKSTAVTKENIYLVYLAEVYDGSQETVRFCETDSYSYMGEKAVKLNRKTLETEEMPIDNVIFMYQISEKELMFYAYDEIGGYYFTIYQTDSEKFGEKNYNNQFDFINGFAVKEDKKTIISCQNGRLVTARIDDEETQAEFAENVFIWYGNNLKCQGDEVYVLDSNQDKNNILRMDYEMANRGNKEIRFYQTQIFEEPYGCGYKMHPIVLEEEEFALSVLAGDMDYDMCMMDSSSSVSREIRDQGAFYPLNEVKNVMEYLDSCHPYIKEAAVNENGEVWMLPISVSIPFLLYGEEGCEKNGIDMENIEDYESLIDKAEKICQNQNLQEWYSINGFQIQSDLMTQYNSEYAKKGERASYQNKEFEKICRLLKEKSVWKNPALHTFMISKQSVEKEIYYSQFLFELRTDMLSLGEEDFQNLSARETPKIDRKMKNKGSCVYFCVNQNSKNLESALSYISDYCEYMKTRNDTYMFQDKTTYPFSDSSLTEDCYEIYSNGEICFELPEEIFWNQYLDFMNGKIDFEEFSKEIERKTNMYNNE